MRSLTILRHGDASYEDPKINDWNRPLSNYGEIEAQKIAKYIKKTLPKPNKIISSNANRTISTAKILLNSNKWDQKILEKKQEMYLASLDTLLAIISEQSDSLEHIVIIGHNPGLSDLCNHLVNQSFVSSMNPSYLSLFITSRYLPTCGCFSIKFNGENWDLQSKIKILDLAYKYPSK